MKKIFLICLMMIVGVTACNKNFLTRDNPSDVTDAKFWQTEQQLIGVIQYLAGSMPGGGFQYLPDSRISLTALTDDAAWTANFLPEINQFALGNGNSNPPTSAYMLIYPFWRDAFLKIRTANRFLENAGKAYVDPDKLNQYMLEVRAVRAFYHMELCMYYGAIPIVTKSVGPDESSLKRNTKDEILNFITSEFTQCAAGLPASYSGDLPYRITKGAAMTMKTVAYLNWGKYAEAAATAKQVVDLTDPTTGAKVYALYKPAATDNYLNLFLYKGEFNQERILSNQSQQGVYLRIAPPNAAGTANVNPTQSLVDTYETKQGKTLAELSPDSLAIYRKNPNYNNNRDPRLAATVVYPGATFYTLVNPFAPAPNVCAVGAINSSRTGYFVRKYCDVAMDRTRPSAGTLDFMIYRLADVMLMRVEALVEGGQSNDPDVIDYLNQIRNRSNMPNVNTAVYNSQDKLRELYRRERRVELAFEGNRWFDIRRWKIAEQVMNGVVYGATNPANGQTVVVENRKFDVGRDYLWPIPVQELQGNTNMAQNPGY
jgi:hypothetical protein